LIVDGVTPKQFETIYKAAKLRNLKRGEKLVTAGDTMESVYLVIEGSTRANILGRHLTAASMTPEMHQNRPGGASGAWVGEMAFLEAYWLKEQTKNSSSNLSNAIANESDDSAANLRFSIIQQESESRMQTKASKSSVNVPSGEDSKGATTEQSVPGLGPLKARTALFTITAREDCRILEWSHDGMEKLMSKSSDMRGGLTRAMSSAIVGKVINFTVSRSKAPTSFTAWLQEWTVSASSSVNVLHQPMTYNWVATSRDDPDSAPAESLRNANQTAVDEQLPSFPLDK
jgi:CRP-like cAMP-binding protein